MAFAEMRLTLTDGRTDVKRLTACPPGRLRSWLRVAGTASKRANERAIAASATYAYRRTCSKIGRSWVASHFLPFRICVAPPPFARRGASCAGHKIKGSSFPIPRSSRPSVRPQTCSTTAFDFVCWRVRSLARGPIMPDVAGEYLQTALLRVPNAQARFSVLIGPRKNLSTRMAIKKCTARNSKVYVFTCPENASPFLL